MTKTEIIEDLDEARTLARCGPATDYFRGQADALDYAIAVVRNLRAPKRPPRTIELHLTPEQARRIDSLLGNGELDRLIRGKITRGMDAL